MRKPFSHLMIGALVFTGVLLGSEIPTQAQVSVQITPPRVRVYRPPGRVWIPARTRCVTTPGRWVYRSGPFREARFWVPGRQRCTTIPGRWVYRR